MARDINEWLRDLELGKYAKVFAENEIDFDALPHVTEEDLKEIGVASGARRKLLAAIAKLDSRIEPAPKQKLIDAKCCAWHFHDDIDGLADG